MEPNNAVGSGTTEEPVQTPPTSGIRPGWLSRGGPRRRSGGGRQPGSLKTLSRCLTKVAVIWALFQTAAVLLVIRLLLPRSAAGDALPVGDPFAPALIFAGAVILLAGLAAALVLVKMVTRMVNRPLRLLTQSVREYDLDAVHQAARLTNAVEIHALIAVLVSQIAELQDRNESLDRVVKLRTAQLAQKVAEQERARDRLIREAKLASLNRLTAGVTHQINNPAAYVTGNLETLREYTEALEQRIDELENALSMIAEAPVAPPDLRTVQDDLAEISHDAEMDQIRRDLPQLIGASIGGMERIKRVMRALSSANDPEPAVFKHEDLHDCVREAVDGVWNEIKYEHSLLLDLEENISARVVRAKLVAALSNILLNAKEALGRNGVIRVSLKRKDLHAQITVSDNGRGIPPDDLQLVFEPFFTSKEETAGAGLGLYMSQRLIDEIGGTIDIQSVPREGTVITLSVPVAQAVEAALS